MKKAVTKVAKVTATPKAKESEFGMLTRLVVDGFERVDKRFDEVDKRFEAIDKRFEGIDSSLFSINYELKDNTRRLDSIERKQTGTLANLDESVHRTEFKALTRRVEIIEKKTIKK